jgi:hypothetical protein
LGCPSLWLLSLGQARESDPRARDGPWTRPGTAPERCAQNQPCRNSRSDRARVAAFVAGRCGTLARGCNPALRFAASTRKQDAGWSAETAGVGARERGKSNSAQLEKPQGTRGRIRSVALRQVGAGMQPRATESRGVEKTIQRRCIDRGALRRAAWKCNLARRRGARAWGVFGKWRAKKKPGFRRAYSCCTWRIDQF